MTKIFLVLVMAYVIYELYKIIFLSDLFAITLFFVFLAIGYLLYLIDRRSKI